MLKDKAQKSLDYKLLMFQDNIVILNSMDITCKDIKQSTPSENGVV